MHWINYDYEEAFVDQIREKEKEEEIRRLPAGSVYALKEIKAGTQLEIEIYPEFRRMSEVPPEGRKPKRDNSKAQRDLNDKNARKNLERLINMNFREGDLWITLTYDADHLPETMEEAVRNMQRYMQRVNYQRKKKGLPPAKYIYVTEHDEDTEVRWHHHIIMDGMLDRDTVEACWKLRSRNTIKKIVPDDDGLSGMAKYICKDYKRKKHERRWNASKGLKKPEIRTVHYKKPKGGDSAEAKKTKERRIRAYVNRMIRDQDEIEQICRDWYPDYTFTESQIFYNQWNQQYYIRARMRRNKHGTTGDKDDRSRKHLSAPGQSAERPGRSYRAGRKHKEKRDHAEPDSHSGTLRRR